MVFRYPINPSLDYIKRVVGLPGDEVVYRNKRLTVNGTEMPMKRDGEYNYVEGGLNFNASINLNDPDNDGIPDRQPWPGAPSKPASSPSTNA